MQIVDIDLSYRLESKANRLFIRLHPIILPRYLGKIFGGIQGSLQDPETEPTFQYQEEGWQVSGRKEGYGFPQGEGLRRNYAQCFQLVEDTTSRTMSPIAGHKYLGKFHLEEVKQKCVKRNGIIT